MHNAIITCILKDGKRRLLSAVVDDINSWAREHGKTQHILAEAIGRSQSSVSRLLAKRTERYTKLVDVLCEYAGIKTHMPLDLNDFHEPRTVLEEVLDGSPSRESAVADLIRAARAMG